MVPSDDVAGQITGDVWLSERGWGGRPNIPAALLIDRWSTEQGITVRAKGNATGSDDYSSAVDKGLLNGDRLWTTGAILGITLKRRCIRPLRRRKMAFALGVLVIPA